MATTFELIEAATVGSGGQADITFTSIPSTFTDLCIKISTRSSATANPSWTDTKLQANGVTTGYTNRSLFGFATTASSNTDVNVTGGFANNNISTANTFCNTEIYIPNYAGSNNKSWSVETSTEINSANGMNWMGAVLWSNTAAITSIALIPTSSYLQYSTAYLYGVKNA